LNEVRYRADRRRRLQKMTSYTEDEEEEDAYNLRRRGLQLATSIDCIRIDKN